MSDEENKKIPLLPEVLPKKEKPLINILDGHSGIGKTESIKALADALFSKINDKNSGHEKHIKKIPLLGFPLDQSGSMGDKKSFGSEWERIYRDGSPLFDAVHAGSISRIRELVESGQEDINQTTKLGSNALHMAAQIGGLTVCRELVRLGINIHEEEMFSGHTPLHTAMQSGNDHVAVFLALKGAALEPPKGKMFSPLTWASNGGLLAGSAGTGKKKDPPPESKFSPAAFERIRAKLSAHQARKAKGLTHIRRRKPSGKEGPS